MALTPPSLPFPRDALEPHFPATAVDHLLAQQHDAVTRVNVLLARDSGVSAAADCATGALPTTPADDADGSTVAVDTPAAAPVPSLEILARSGRGQLAAHAAQACAFELFWRSLRPAASPAATAPAGKLAEAINAAHGDLDSFRKRFNAAALSAGGAGWAWLLHHGGNRLAIGITAPGATPLNGQACPLLVCCLLPDTPEEPDDSWLTRRLDAFWELVDWRAAGGRCR